MAALIIILVIFSRFYCILRLGRGNGRCHGRGPWCRRGLRNRTLDFNPGLRGRFEIGRLFLGLRARAY
jgi:hypothetical protein